MMTILFVAALALAPASAQQPETLSLLGKPLVAPPLSEDVRRKLEEDVATARAAYDKAPDDPDAVIWFGRRTAYLGRFGEAIEIFTRGIEAHADEPRLYRHRGHRYITIRKFDLAIKDLRKAALLVEGKPDEVEPDGQPNERNVPTGTLQTNIYYHLGLAHYMKAEFADAATAFRTCLSLSKTPDMRVAAADWLYMALQRLGRADDARAVVEPIAPGLDVIENQAYYRMLLYYKGQGMKDTLSGKGVDAVITAYGLANQDLYTGAHEAAAAALTRIVDKQTVHWPSFAYIAAESELARIQKNVRKKHKARD
jgi:tetratricopeptide (TPR) repeat protein